MDDRAVARGTRYVGRFAPSPTGLLHAGSLVAALASWLDARAHGGRWLVRIEDLDTARNVAGAAEAIVAQLESVGLRADGAIVRQSQRTALYDAALHTLEAQGRAYPCACSRRDLALAVAAPAGANAARVEAIYPGTCRAGLRGRAQRSLRLRVESVDGSVLAFTFGVSILTGIVFGLAPAVRTANVDLNSALKTGGRNTLGDGAMPSGVK